MSAREVIVRALRGIRVRSHTSYADEADAILDALNKAGKVVVDRKTLIEARDEITAYVKREYAGCEGYPSMEARMQRDLELARELDRLVGVGKHV